MDAAIKERIEKLLQENQVFLFMKGSPAFPQCGFSARAIAILKECGSEFGSFDVLSDDDVRMGIKEFGQWPTIPQLYVRQELVGGSDIMMEMYQSGELQELLKNA